MTEHILLVNDEPLFLSAYRHDLGAPFNIDIASSGAEALELFDRAGDNPYTVVVSDMRIPDMNGIQLLKRLAAAHPRTIRILLTDNADQRTAVDAVNQGHVFKFLAKPCSASNLREALDEALDHYRAEREPFTRDTAVQAGDPDARLSYQARHDVLTGLASRRAFELRLKSSLESARLEGRQHIFCFIDIDYFHHINDACGHTAGDELLRQLGTLLSRHRRSGDIAARLGGDRFGLILSDCSLQDGQQIAQKIHQLIKTFVFHWEEASYELSTSIGLVPVNGESGSVTSLLDAAETACNVAKEQGRNRIHSGDAGDALLTRRLSEIQWISRINRAITENRFRLYYQTIEPIDPVENEGEYYEILIRMQGRDGRIIPPGEFLPAAEHYQLASQIDRWVILNSIGWLNDNPDQLQTLSLCSINLSEASLTDPEMPGFIQEALAGSAVPAGKLCFEITETAAISHLDAAIDFMQTLKATGIRFSLDDFGTGFSSFAYLRTLPVDFLKIGGLFVHHIDRNIIDWTLVKSINDMGQIMGKQTIAEFVENEDIYNQLHEIGANYAQGYLLSKPTPLFDKGILLLEQES